jgi:hypothetical protein
VKGAGDGDESEEAVSEVSTSDCSHVLESTLHGALMHAESIGAGIALASASASQVREMVRRGRGHGREVSPS